MITLWPEAPPSSMRYFPDRIELHVFLPEEEGETVSFLHEDDGCTFAFKQGRFLLTKFALCRRGRQLVIRAFSSGQGFAEFARNEFSVRFHGNVSEISLDDQPIESGEKWFIIPQTNRDFVLRANIIA